MPFGNNARHKNDIKYRVLNEPLVFRPTDDISPVTRALLEGLLAKHPRNRLTLEQIKSHPYFQDVYVAGVTTKPLSLISYL
jgi:serine/threonine protein kinase